MLESLTCRERSSLRLLCRVCVSVVLIVVGIGLIDYNQRMEIENGSVE